MKSSKFIFVVFLLCCLSGVVGCATLSTPSVIPGVTVADRQGQEIILDHIRWLEAASGRSDCDTKVVWTKFISTELRTIIEHWTVESCGVTSIYKIRITPQGNGGMKYTVTYPLPADL